MIFLFSAEKLIEFLIESDCSETHATMICQQLVDGHFLFPLDSKQILFRRDPLMFFSFDRPNAESSDSAMEEELEMFTLENLSNDSELCLSFMLFLAQSKSACLLLFSLAIESLKRDRIRRGSNEEQNEVESTQNAIDTSSIMYQWQSRVEKLGET